jgi:hypothetical protein
MVYNTNTAYSLADYLWVGESLTFSYFPTLKQSDVASFETRIAKCHGDQLCVLVPSQLISHQILYPHASVDILLHHDGQTNIPHFVGKIKALSLSPTPHCWVTMPVELPLFFKKMREFLRVPLDVTVAITLPGDPDNEASPPQLLYGKTINLSGGGLKLVAEKAFNREEIINVSFQPSPDGPVVSAQGRVVQIVPSGKAYMMAIAFTYIMSRHQDYVIQWCVQQDWKRTRSTSR